MFTGVGHFVMQLFQRQQVRETLRIRGNLCTDLLKICCCSCCALVQEEREVKDHQKGTLVQQPAQPRTQGGMSYTPQ